MENDKKFTAAMALKRGIMTLKARAQFSENTIAKDDLAAANTLQGLLDVIEGTTYTVHFLGEKDS